MSNLISIIIPVYNREDYIEECLKSVFEQSFQDYEVIIIDDGSCDNTVNICKQLAEKDSRIKLFEAMHGGVSAARNFGLEKATGKYVFFLDSDDFIHPKTLESLYLGMEETDAQIGGTSVVNVNEKIWHKIYEKINSQPNISAYEFVEHNSAVNTIFTSMSPINLIGGTIMRRDYIGDTRFKTDLFIGEDFYFIYENLIKGANCLFLKEKWYYARIGDKNSSFVYDYNAFWSRFHRRELVWKNEEVLGRKHFAKLQKLDAFGCYISCLKHSNLKSDDFEKIQKKMKEYKKELFSAFDMKYKIIYYLAVFAPSVYLKIKK